MHRHLPTAWAALLAGMVLSGASLADDVKEVYVVHQHTDSSAARAVAMFKFDPPVLALEAGDTVAFLNSTGSHTVQSQKGLWPADVAPIHIRGERRADVTFSTPGLYGITCARHGRYGMTMLIAVGPEGRDAAATLDSATIPATDAARASFSNHARALAETGR